VVRPSDRHPERLPFWEAAFQRPHMSDAMTLKFECHACAGEFIEA